MWWESWMRRSQKLFGSHEDLCFKVVGKISSRPNSEVQHMKRRQIFGALAHSFFFLLSGHPPVQASGDPYMVKIAKEEGVVDIFSGNWVNISWQARHLLIRMLRSKPADRITPNEALAHEWLSPAQWISPQWNLLDLHSLKIDVEMSTPPSSGKSAIPSLSTSLQKPSGNTTPSVVGFPAPKAKSPLRTRRATEDSRNSPSPSRRDERTINEGIRVSGEGSARSPSQSPPRSPVRSLSDGYSAGGLKYSGMIENEIDPSSGSVDSFPPSVEKKDDVLLKALESFQTTWANRKLAASRDGAINNGDLSEQLNQPESGYLTPPNATRTSEHEADEKTPPEAVSPARLGMPPLPSPAHLRKSKSARGDRNGALLTKPPRQLASGEPRQGSGKSTEISSDYAAALAAASRQVDRKFVNSLTRGSSGDFTGIRGALPRTRTGLPTDRVGMSLDSSLGSIDVDELVPLVEVGDKTVHNLLDGLKASSASNNLKDASNFEEHGGNGDAKVSTIDIPISEEEEQVDAQSMIVDGMGRRLLQSPMSAHPRRKHGRSSHVFC